MNASSPSEIDATLREQRDYYCARAAEYDDGYRRVGRHDRSPEENASWQVDLNRLARAFDAVAVSGDVLELAAGTGYWTERLATRACSLHVIDGSAETLAINRERAPAATRVEYEVADLFEWQPSRVWDACVFCFWFCHVPDVRVAGFLSTVAASLRPGGVVCVVDKFADARTAIEGNDRRINDGRRFSIIDHPRPPEQLIEMFAVAGLDIEVETFGKRFCLAHGTRT